MRTRALILAALLVAAAFGAMAELRSLGAVLGLVVLVALVAERWLVPEALRRDPDRPPLGLRTGGARASLRVAGQVVLAAVPLCAVLLALAVLWVRTQGVTEAQVERMPRDFRTFDEVPGWLWRAVVLAPLAEELLWRGLVQQHLARALGVRLAIVLSGVLFWIFHWIPWGGPTAVNQLVGGWVLAWSFARTGGGLLAPILLHATGNLAIGASITLWILRPEWLRALFGWA